MTIAVCFNLFETKIELRDAELKMAFEKNCETPNSVMHVIVDSNVTDKGKYAVDWSKIVIVNCPFARPTFKFWMNYIKLLDPNVYKVGVITNSDIYLDGVFADDILQTKWGPKECYALTRWDVKSLSLEDTHAATFYEKWNYCSQDVWCFPIPLEVFPENIDFPLGVWGCDNRFAHEIFVKAGEALRNPSRRIRIYHLHNITIARKTRKEECVKPPYHCIPATK